MKRSFLALVLLLAGPAAAEAPASAPTTLPVIEVPGTPASPSTRPAPPPPTLRTCCAALRQAAASTPPPSNGYYQTAAAACDGLVEAPRAAALTMLRSIVRGAPLPAACR